MAEADESLYCIAISKFNRLRIRRNYKLRGSFQDDLTDRRIEKTQKMVRGEFIEDVVRKAEGCELIFILPWT